MYDQKLVEVPANASDSTGCVESTYRDAIQHKVDEVVWVLVTKDANNLKMQHFLFVC